MRYERTTPSRPAVILPILLVMLFVSYPVAAQLGTWTTKTPMPTARYASVSGLIGNQMYVVGGNETPTSCCFTPKSVVNEAYDPGTNTWATHRPELIGRANAAGDVINGNLYIVGGGGVTLLNQLDAYDPIADQWRTLAPMPTPRTSPAAAAIGGKLYVAGGMQDCAPCTALQTLEIYDAASNTWTKGADMPIAVTFASAAAVNGLFYILGGNSNPASTVTLGKVQVYNPATNSWSLALSSEPTPRGIAAASVLNGFINVIGGECCLNAAGVFTTTSANEAYNPATDTWIVQAPMPTARTQLVARTIFSTIYAVGGQGTTGSTFNVNEAFTCRHADGDGDTKGNNGGSAHFHFHHDDCNEQPEDEEFDDPEAGTSFRSTHVGSVTYDDTVHSATITGSGTNNGLRVTFTIVGVDSALLPPGKFTITLSDGYANTGNLLNGGITLH